MITKQKLREKICPYLKLGIRRRKFNLYILICIHQSNFLCTTSFIFATNMILFIFILNEPEIFLPI